MAHPHHDLRDHKVSERRLGTLYGHMPHRAAGGSVEHSDERQDKALVKSMVKGASLKASGGKVNARADRPCRARGGKVKKGKGTNVNVIIAPQGGGGMPPGPPPMALKPPMPGGPPMPPGAPPPGAPPMMPHKSGGRAYKAGGRVKRAWGGAMPAMQGMPTNGMRPAMGAPMGGAAMGNSMRPMVPPAMPASASGAGMGVAGPGMMQNQMAPSGMGLGYKKGGAVKSGPTWNEGLKNETPVQHNDSGKTADQKDGQPSRKGMRVVTFWAGGAVKRKTGGPVFANGKAGAQMAPKLPSGSGGGEGRLAKRKLGYGKPAKEVNGAR